MSNNKLMEAIRYMSLNQSLSFHHVALKFGVNVSDLQNEWAKQKGAQNETL